MENEKTDELLPCPLCGLSVKLYENPSRDGTIIWRTINHGPTVDCGIRLIHDERETIIKQWNTRTKN